MGIHQTKGGLILLLLTQGSLVEVDTITGAQGEGAPSLSEAIKLRQIKEIETLNKILANKFNDMKKKEDENENLKKKVSEQQAENENVLLQHLTEKRAIEEDIKGNMVILDFVKKVLHHSEEIMRNSEAAITRQSEILETTHAENEECQQKNEDNAKFMFETQEAINLQNDNVEKLKNVITYTESLNASYHDMENIKPSKDNCNLPSFVTSMAKVLSDQQEIRRDLKDSLESDEKINDYLDIIQTEITRKYMTAKQSDEQWESLLTYQNTIRQQSKTIGQLRTLSSLDVNMTSAFRYEEDETGNVVSASPCKCIPQIENNTQVSIVVAREEKKFITLWSPWEYHDCFEWEKEDNTTIQCGASGKMVRQRLKDLISTEMETEEMGCSECSDLPGIEVGSWTNWTTCMGKDQKTRRKLSLSGIGLRSEVETKDCPPMHNQCYQPYVTLQDSWRKIKYSDPGTSVRECDKDLDDGWYRFVFNNTNAWIPTKPPPKKNQYIGKTCGTHATAWLDGSLPKLLDPPKTIPLKFACNEDDDYGTRTRSAKVVACIDDSSNTFYLYYLVGTLYCTYGYCAMTP